MLTNGIKTIIPTKPKIIEGTPLVASIILVIIVLNLPSLAYKTKYMLPPIPKGKENSKVNKIKYIVQISEPLIPPPNLLHCKKEIQTNQRSLKFYKSQYSDSDIFSECLPLVDVYEKKIELYEKNIQKTNDIISTLDEIINILSNWK